MTALSFNRVFVLALALALMSVPARAQSVDVDYDKSVDFRAFKTYALGTVKMPDDANPLMVQRIVSAVDSHMAAIGFRKVERAPDVRIAIHGTTRRTTPGAMTTARISGVVRTRTWGAAGTPTGGASATRGWTCSGFSSGR